MERLIQYTRAADGVRIAYWTLGTGEPPGGGWGLRALAIIAAAIGAFAWWDRRQPPRA